METTERIVEAYIRYVKGWMTISNLRCPGQNEIDLLAIDPVTLDRYHVEVSISISQGFSRLTSTPYDPETAKIRTKVAPQRRTLGFFEQKKFASPGVVETLAKYGFDPGNYRKVIVSWGWNADVPMLAEKAGIELWDFRDITHAIATEIGDKRHYFNDDTLRTLHLFIQANAERDKLKPQKVSSLSSVTRSAPASASPPFWVYTNQPNNKALIHRADCSHCNDGRGRGEEINDYNGQWSGFSTAVEAEAYARQSGKGTIRWCGLCGGVNEMRKAV